MSKQIQKKNLNKSLDRGDEHMLNSVKLAVPWDDATSCFLTERLSNSMGTPSGDIAKSFVRERTQLHELFIREQEKTKRVGLILATVMILAAASLVLFVPQGRETLSYWIGAALVVFAAGTVGYKRIWSKTNSASFGADQEVRSELSSGYQKNQGS